MSAQRKKLFRDLLDNVDDPEEIIILINKYKKKNKNDTVVEKLKFLEPPRLNVVLTTLLSDDSKTLESLLREAPAPRVDPLREYFESESYRRDDFSKRLEHINEITNLMFDAFNPEFFTETQLDAIITEILSVRNIDAKKKIIRDFVRTHRYDFWDHILADGAGDKRKRIETKLRIIYGTTLDRYLSMFSDDDLLKVYERFKKNQSIPLDMIMREYYEKNIKRTVLVLTPNKTVLGGTDKTRKGIRELLSGFLTDAEKARVLEQICWDRGVKEYFRNVAMLVLFLDPRFNYPSRIFVHSLTKGYYDIRHVLGLPLGFRFPELYMWPKKTRSKIEDLYYLHLRYIRIDLQNRFGGASVEEEDLPPFPAEIPRIRTGYDDHLVWYQDRMWDLRDLCAMILRKQRPDDEIARYYHVKTVCPEPEKITTTQDLLSFPRTFEKHDSSPFEN
jgi:hypothetical protein